MLDTMYAVLHLRNEGDDAMIPLFDDVHIAFRAESINQIVEERPEEARYFVGFVSWAAGELAEEIEKGFWYVMRPQAEAVFREDSDGLWAELVRQARGTVSFTQ
jgi:putative AlgH/UPF0301 family transcriptional regulator